MIHQVVQQAESGSDDESEPQVVMGIMEDSEDKEDDDESSEQHERGSENNSTSHVEVRK
jgi:hypothetical protein